MRNCLMVALVHRLKSFQIPCVFASNRVLPVGSFLVLLLTLSASVHAHFKLNLNIRVIHIAHTADGLDVYMRVPMPYLVAALSGPEREDGTRTAAPFTTNAMVDGTLMHYADITAINANTPGLGEIAATGHQLSVKGTSLEPLVKIVKVHTGLSQPPFSTLDEAKLAMAAEQPPLLPPPFVGDSVVDVLLEYRSDQSINRYSIASSLNPNLEGQEETANLIVDYGAAEPRIHRIRGLLTEPVEISHSILKAAYTFVVEGFRHILEGYDHVLFVICLVLGTTALGSLAWRVTGFTLGHSITLSLGFFGFVPTAAWFVPLIETGIALSIIVAAFLALATDSKAKTSSAGFIVTVVVGMLHGLGFSFVLQEILGVTSPNIWVSLLSFNIGVELGQLLIVVLLWPVLYLIMKYLSAWYETTRWIIALPCIAVAAYWTGERLLSFMVLV